MNAVPLHPLTLRFTDPVVERAFLQQDFPRLVAQSRVSSLVAISCYLALGLLFDHLLFPPESRETVWHIRLAALLVPLGVLLLTFHPLFRKCNHLPIAMIGLAGGIGLILMSLHLPTDKLEFYYPGLVVIVFFTYNLAGTRFIYALTVDLVLFISYNLAMLGRDDVPAVMLAVSDLYILMANLIGGAAGYLTERQQRRLFLGERRLREEMQKVQAAQREAQQAYVTRTRFLAAVSHDLRQPVHAQGLFLNLLQQTPLNERQQTMVAHIQAASAASSEMLHTLMDYSRLEAGAVQPNLSSFSLQPLLNKIEREFMPLADAKGLAYRSRETRLAVCSDPSLVEVILRNLVANAIRYTASGGLLVVCRKRGEQVVLAVYDTGIGIKPADQAEVFREFQQLVEPHQTTTQGLGLGLAIVKGMANTLQHPIKLVSVPGQGSCFQLWLPLADPCMQEQATETSALQPITGQPDAALRVLLVEDNPVARAALTEQLHCWGLACDAVDNLEDALAAASKHPPALIISDFHLHQSLTGAEVIQQLRQMLDKKLPALLMTGDTSPDYLHQAEQLGLPLLYKPVEPAELYRTLVALMNAPDVDCPNTTC